MLEVYISFQARITIFYTTLLFTVGTLFYTLKSNDWGGYGEQQSHANFHLRLQFVLLLLMGVICFAMPQWTVKLTVLCVVFMLFFFCSNLFQIWSVHFVMIYFYYMTLSCLQYIYLLILSEQGKQVVNM